MDKTINGNINGNIGHIENFNNKNIHTKLSAEGIVTIGKNKLDIKGYGKLEYHPNILKSKTRIIESSKNIILGISDIVDGNNNYFLLFCNKIIIERQTIQQMILFILHIKDGLTHTEVLRLNYLKQNFKKLNQAQISELEDLMVKKDNYIKEHRENYLTQKI